MDLELMYKRKVKFLIIGIVIVLVLIIFLAIMGRGSCNECKINFTNNEIAGMKLDKPITYEVPVNDLYDGLLNDQCVIKFSRTDGYYQ